MYCIISFFVNNNTNPLGKSLRWIHESLKGLQTSICTKASFKSQLNIKFVRALSKNNTKTCQKSQMISINRWIGLTFMYQVTKNWLLLTYVVQLENALIKFKIKVKKFVFYFWAVNKNLQHVDFVYGLIHEDD